MQKTITINGKRYTGRQILDGLTFNKENYTYWFGDVYVVPRGYESDVSMHPGALCDPKDAAFVEVCDFKSDTTKMLEV